MNKENPKKGSSPAYSHSKPVADGASVNAEFLFNFAVPTNLMSSGLLYQFIRSRPEPEASEQFDESRVRAKHFELPVRSKTPTAPGLSVQALLFGQSLKAIIRIIRFRRRARLSDFRHVRGGPDAYPDSSRDPVLPAN
jgi:hypothetical protein